MKPFLLAGTILLLMLALCPFSQCGGATAYIAGMVYEDKNFNGERDEGEPGIAGARMELLDEDGNTIETQFTDSDGRYSFQVSLLRSQEYNLKIYAPEEYVLKGGTTTQQFKLDMTNVEDTYTKDIGLYSAASVGETGPSNEPPVQGSITLTPSEDTVVTEPFPGDNYGALDNFWIDDQSVVYLRFMLESLPPEVIIESVVLNLFLDNTGSAGGETALVTYPDPSQPWNEMEMTWDNRPPYAPGALSAPLQMTDYSGKGSADSVDLTTVFRYFQETHLNQQYFDTMIYYTEPGHPSQGWYSRESQNPPQLEISYSVP